MLHDKEHIRLLWQLYLTNQASPEQARELLQLIADERHEAELMDVYHEVALLLGPASGKPSTVTERKEAWDALMASDNSLARAADQTMAPVHRVHFLRRGWFRYAAAVLLLVGAGIYFWFANTKDDPSKKNSGYDLAAVITPGHDQAVLKLADGSTIVLDSARGNIVHQGGFKVTNLEGRLDYEGNAGTVEYHTLSTPRGGQYKLQLPDGTAVWLNAASSISYPTAFTGKQRKVTITGEAYFEVAKDKAHPFVVNVNDRSEVEVLGTHFNINAYNNEGDIKTTLLEGKVKVSATQPETSNPKPETLFPGQQAIITNKITIKDDISIDKIMAWKNGLFNFDGLDVRSVMRQLERWYDIDVEYEGKVPEILFRGKLNRRVSFSDVLEILPELGVKYRLQGRTLIVTG